jgi:hypothetical protein
MKKFIALPATVALALSIFVPAAGATVKSTPTATDVAVASAAESALTSWLAHYQPTTAWQVELKTLEATAAADLAKVNADLGGPKPFITFPGNGSENLPGFTIPRTAKSWGLDWWVSGCPGLNFTVNINSKGGDVGPSPKGPDSQTSGHGSDVYTDTGSVEFQVFSDCYWTLKVF